MAGVPVFRLAGTAANGTSSVVVAWPTHATNEVGLLRIQTEAQATTLVTNGAWTQVTASPQTTGTAAATNAVALQVYWARATSAAMPNVTVNDAGDHVLAQIITFTNCKTTGDPFELTVGGVKAAASTNIAVTGGTTTKNLALIVDCIAGTLDSATAQASQWTNASLSGYGELSGSDVATTTGGGGQLYAGAGGLATAGAIPQSTVTIASNSKNAWIRVALIGDDWTGTGSLTATPALSGAVPADVSLALSAHIGAGATNATTARLTAPTGKTSGADFQAGKISDDTNPVSLDLTSDKYTELEWCIQLHALGAAYNGEAFDFRVTDGGTPLATYTVTPRLTVGSGFTGTGGLAASLPAMAGTGIVGNIGTGSLTATPILAGTGSQPVTGSGGIAAAAPAMAGTGIVGNIGSGSLQTAPTFTGTGNQPITASGSITAAQPVFSGTGTASSGVTGTGSLTATPALSGTGIVGVIGTGSLTATPVMAATGSQPVTGTGSLAPAVPTMAGTGIVGVLGTGSLTATPVLTGTGTQVFTGTGGFALSAPTMAGLGPGGSITGTGTIVAPQPTLAATGTQQFTGTGSLAGPTASFTGVGSQPVTGSGSLTGPTATVTGSGTITGSGIGALTGPTATFTGSGTVTQSGTGAIAVPLPVFSGTGTAASAVTGSGSFTLAAPAFAGTATIVGLFIGSGSLTAQARFRAGCHVQQTHTGKYKPEHDDALAALGGLGSFAAEHQAALDAVEEAGE